MATTIRICGVICSIPTLAAVKAGGIKLGTPRAAKATITGTCVYVAFPI